MPRQASTTLCRITDVEVYPALEIVTEHDYEDLREIYGPEDLTDVPDELLAALANARDTYQAVEERIRLCRDGENNRRAASR